MIETLKDFARKELWLKDKQVDGLSREAHLESVWRQTGVMPPELAPVECPEELLYLWGYFLDVGLRRSGNGYSINPVSNLELEAWARVVGIGELTPFEVDALTALELLYLAHHAPKLPAEKTK